MSTRPSVNGIATAVIAMLLWPVGLSAQTSTPCRSPVPAPAPDTRNIFSPSQEADLGEAIAQSEFLSLRILAEGDVYLQGLAVRLIRNTALSTLRGDLSNPLRAEQALFAKKVARLEIAYYRLARSSAGHARNVISTHETRGGRDQIALPWQDIRSGSARLCVCCGILRGSPP